MTADFRDYYFAVLRTVGRIMQMGRSRRLIVLALAASMTAPGVAHHSPAAYDTAAETIVEGTLTEVFWRNPHVYLTLEVVDADGAVTEQEIEVVAPSSLTSVGVRQDDLQVGERVRVRVNPNRRGLGREALGLALTRPNGAVVALRGGVLPPPPLPARTAATSLSGRWTPDARQFLALARIVREEQSWPLTDAGRVALADVAARAAGEATCEPHGIPMIMMSPGVTAIALEAERVRLDVDGASVQRVIHLGVETPPADFEPGPDGYSIGRWEGRTLSVETTAFAPSPKGLGFGLPSSAGKRVVERFTLGADGLTLEYAATLEDPAYLTEPVSMTSTWSYRPDLETSGMGCDPESAVRFFRSATTQ
jgi:hypothetical protein